MKLSLFKHHLVEHAEKHLRFALPTGTQIPAQAHVTEVARIDKRFVDCGGTLRNDSLCRLQTWVADDTDHRLTAGKLLEILEKASALLEPDDLEVDVEHEAPFISQFTIAGADAEAGCLVVRLGTKHTACLAEDRCRPPTPISQTLSFKPLSKIK